MISPDNGEKMNIDIQCEPKCSGCFAHLLSPVNKRELVGRLFEIPGDVISCPFAPASDGRLKQVITKKDRGSLILRKEEGSISTG
jgi:hypothetical protein